MDERLRKWRLILGSKADANGELSLKGDDVGMDEVLDALYDSDRKEALAQVPPILTGG